MSYPKIIYTPSGQAQQTLAFTYPARQIPGYQRQAVRHDNIASSGIRETVLERFEDVIEIQVPAVPLADVAAWQTFFNHALAGGAFDYYPDASAAAYTTYLLEDQDSALAYKAPGLYSTRLKMRKRVA